MMNKYYWDTCVILTWLGQTNFANLKGKEKEKQEKEHKKRLQEIDSFLQSVENVQIITSIITKAEILPGSLTDQQKRQLQKLYTSHKILLVELTPKMVDLAAQVRNDYKYPPKNQEERSIKLPDALHLATAISLNVESFHTFDDKLLKLDGRLHDKRLEGNKESSSKNLKIIRPQTLSSNGQLSLL
jgi:predicted nucleic acid-binding protein